MPMAETQRAQLRPLLSDLRARCADLPLPERALLIRRTLEGASVSMTWEEWDTFMREEFGTIPCDGSLSILACSAEESWRPICPTSPLQWQVWGANSDFRISLLDLPRLWPFVIQCVGTETFVCCHRALVAGSAAEGFCLSDRAPEMRKPQPLFVSSGATLLGVAPKGQSRAYLVA